jgi:hypothetical protein
LRISLLAELERSGEDQISLTDPDSRAMAAYTGVAVGYNVQIAVDAKHKLIVEQQVTNQVLDMGLLTETAEPAKEVLGVEQMAVVADRGYFKIEDIEACEKAGMEPYVPRPQRGPSVRAGLYRKDEFQYDPETDTILCPGGQRLQRYSSSVLRALKKINYANRQACRDCPLRSRCTNNSFLAAGAVLLAVIGRALLAPNDDMGATCTAAPARPRAAARAGKPTCRNRTGAEATNLALLLAESRRFNLCHDRVVARSPQAQRGRGCKWLAAPQRSR